MAGTCGPVIFKFSAEQLVLATDAAAGPFLIAMQRFGATLKDFPKLAKYTETLKVQ